MNVKFTKDYINKLNLINKNTILNTYKNYKKFIGIEDLGELEIKFYDGCKVNKKGKMAYVLLEDLYNSKNILYCDLQVFELVPNYVPQLLFHEFTHIWDGCILRQNRSFESFSKIMLCYSEYHASKIELMKALGFKEIFNQKLIKITDEVICLNKKYSLQQRLDSYFEECVSDINNAIKEGKRDLEKTAIKKLMYYLGQLDLCQEFCVTNITSRLHELPILFAPMKLYKILYERSDNEVGYNKIEELYIRLLGTFEKCRIFDENS